MAANSNDITRWLKQGKELGASHMLVVTDTYDLEDYPVYVKPGEDMRHTFSEYNRNLQKVMEVYALKQDLPEQLAEHRAVNLD